MSEIVEKKTIQNLLSQIKTISRSYDKVEKALGENFNIFSVLGIEHYEETTHSRFIGELLNMNGHHNFGNKFLIAFLNILDLNNIDFDFINYNIYLEHYIGNVTETTGGRIDILLVDCNDKKLMIENKIYAREQKNQLLRYYNYDESGTLLFLTLYGYNSDNHKSFESYINISYSENIIKWLNRCQEIAVENPILRETIKQYKNLIKKLTNQNINSFMNEEIANLFIRNRENYKALLTLSNQDNFIDEFYKAAINDHLVPILEEIKTENPNYKLNYNLENLLNKKGEWINLFNIRSKYLESKNININFTFSSKNKMRGLIGGFNFNNQEDKNKYDYSHLNKKFKEVFSSSKVRLYIDKSDYWTCHFDYWGFMHWDYLNDLNNIIHGNFKENLKEKVIKLINIAESSGIREISNKIDNN